MIHKNNFGKTGQSYDDRIYEKLEKSILHGLSCEWDNALWILSDDHKSRMKKPLFSLCNMTSKIGYWSGEKKEICLSKTFILNHPWESIREVLLHEMAHQFVQQIFNLHDECGHGKMFKKACYYLRANPNPSIRFAGFDDKMSDTSPDSNDKILIKVKKLMALSQSCNCHEAKAAMLKAHKLIARYNIDLLSQNKNRDYISAFVGKPALRHFREQYHLARLLQDFYFVQGIWVNSYVVEKNKMGRVLEITGNLQNIKIALYIYDFVSRYIDNNWQKYNKTKKLNRYRKTDFAIGIVNGFTEKLKSQDTIKIRDKNEFALEKIKDPLLAKYLTYKYPKTVHLKRNVNSMNENVLQDGIKIGKKLVIYKGIIQKVKNSRLLIKR